MSQSHHEATGRHPEHRNASNHEDAQEKAAYRLLEEGEAHARVRKDDDGRVTRASNGLASGHYKHVFGFEYTGSQTTPDLVNEKSFHTTLIKQPDPDNTWLRYADHNKHKAPTRFDGDVKVDGAGTVSYLGDHGSYVDRTGHAHKFDAQDTIFEKSGAVVEKETIEGKKYVSKVSKNGATAEFTYDAEGQPFSVQMRYKDGHNQEHSFWYVKGTDNRWYKNEPGHDDVLAAISKIERVDDSGKVCIKINGHDEIFGG